MSRNKFYVFKLSLTDLKILVSCYGWAVRGGRNAHFREFPTVKVQQTFYKLLKPETLRGWGKEAPEGFVFCTKAWQGITHLPKSPTWRHWSP